MMRYSKSEATTIMRQVARTFGAKNKGLDDHDAMRDVYEFWERFPVCLNTNLNDNYCFYDMMVSELRLHTL